MNKIKIHEILGRNYSTRIIEHLTNLGFTAPRGGVLTRRVVQSIVNGETVNLPIMEAITEFVIETEKRLKKVKKALK